MSDCSCLYGSDDNDGPEFYSRSWVKARKPHQCCECHRTIRAGETYERYSGKWDGDMEVFTTCAECQDIRESLYCDAWCFKMLWDDVRDQLFCQSGLTIACIDKLTTAAAKQKLQGEWVAYLGEQ